jgi:hypothetical protein
VVRHLYRDELGYLEKLMLAIEQLEMKGQLQLAIIRARNIEAYLEKCLALE